MPSRGHIVLALLTGVISVCVVVLVTVGVFVMEP